MDTLSHGLWGGVACGRKSRMSFWLAFFLGAAPDLFSFGPLFLGWALSGFPETYKSGEPPNPALIPALVFQLYNVTHSLLVWLAVFSILYTALKRPPWVFGAWALHILCDIPTHTTRYFPTPYLWPFPTPFVNGFRWSVWWFMLLNYGTLAAAYGWAFFKKRKEIPGFLEAEAK